MTGTRLAYFESCSNLLTLMKKIITSVIAIVAFSAMAGVAQAQMLAVAPAPDISSTSALMGIALVGLAAARRYFR
jgi:hypothetical protein